MLRMDDAKTCSVYWRVAACCISVLALLGLALSGVASGEDEKTVVICTNSALADFTTNLFGEELGDAVEVEFIMPAGVCPSHFDTTPSDVVTIASADVVVSLGWEPWLADLLDASGNDGAHQIACMGLGEWNIPSGAAAHLDVIAEGLSEFSPQWADTLVANADNYSAAIAVSYEAARAQIEALGLNGTKVITVEWHSVFLTGLGFEVVASYGAPEGLSTEDVIELSNKCDDPEVAMVVDNMQSTVDFGANLAADFGKEHVVLSNFPGAVPGNYPYIDNMVYNVDELINAAVAYEDTQTEISELESEVSSLEFQRLVLMSIAVALAVILALFAVISRRQVR
ncbi:MAG: metal ABC transporter substrate-binding protein [Candidatus Thermoplasmatota archaeon]|nr:metal ABC transporter substrate-binding protein [Candidatus Thermoplasmatota archaeon]